MDIKYIIFCKTYRVPILHRISDYIIKNEGGEKTSTTLRKYSRNILKCDIGMYTYGGIFDPGFNNWGDVKCGRYCSIAQKVTYFAQNHPVSETITTSPVVYSENWGGQSVLV